MQNLIDFIWEHYSIRFPNDGYEKFQDNLRKYGDLKPFPANGNIFESKQSMTPEVHYIMRLQTQWFLTKAFESMLIDVNDSNISDSERGNIGSPGRICKMWVGSSLDDDSEFGSGRFSKPVRLAKFPNIQSEYAQNMQNTTKVGTCKPRDIDNIPITKQVSIVSSCSHHFAPFSTLFDENSYAIISYIPDKFVLGISKLQRLTDYVCRRFWLQEDLTKALYEEVSKAAETKDVYVGLFNIKHTCEWLRGAKNPEGGFTSEYYDGQFNDSKLRKQIKKF